MAGAALPRDQLDWILKLARRTVRYLWVAVPIVALGVAATLLLARRKQPLYASEAVVFYQEGVSLNLIGSEGGPNTRKMGQRLKEAVMAHTSVEALVKDFHLYPELTGAAKMSEAIDKARDRINFR